MNTPGIEAEIGGVPVLIETDDDRPGIDTEIGGVPVLIETDDEPVEGDGYGVNTWIAR